MQQAAIPKSYVQVSNDAAAFNRIANDPSVLPWVSTGGPVDVTDVLADPDNIGFLGKDCAFIAHNLEPAVYEVHSMGLPHVRGEVIYSSACEAIRCMFMATPAIELLTRVPEGNVAATALALKVGFVPDFDREHAWGDKSVRYYALRYPDWIKRQNWLCASGEWFHDLLGDGQTHEHDPAHDLRVGACVEMVKAGQSVKGVLLYNRWARFAGYAPVDIISHDPLVIDIVSHIVKFENGEVEAIPCQ